MKRKTTCTIVLAIGVFLCVTFLAGGQVFAEWMNVPGSSGQINSKTGTTPWLGNYIHEYGMKFFMDPGVNTEVIFAIPSRYTADIGARYLKLRIRSGNTNSTTSVVSVDVYNGETKVATVPGPWVLNTGAWRNINIDTLSMRTFPWGLSVRLNLSNGVNQSIIWIAGIGANFVAMP